MIYTTLAGGFDFQQELVFYKHTVFIVHPFSIPLGFFVLLYSSWQDFNWCSTSRGTSATAEPCCKDRGMGQTDCRTDTSLSP